ncbi:hypothetical protein NHN26_05240 [Rhodovulum tesquicola]|uniref:hypothetical protein n=1 Tax=Rhodovulum tesquicola TaxID=540254 RepID=UPI0020970D98|nr:hypothetical protein [Rhodovulum tesquicola]MCO8144624.1 hypothetical protein [Rhodovulum tesquicola]
MTHIAHTKVEDVTMWFKHVDSAALRARLEALDSEEEIALEVQNVVGRWRRMRTGRDGRRVNGLRPVGPMKDVWLGWFETEKGKVVTVRTVTMADDFSGAASALMVEWTSPEDEAAFAGL